MRRREPLREQSTVTKLATRYQVHPNQATHEEAAARIGSEMDASVCIEALQEALARFGKPDIFNTDQGTQFNSGAFTRVLTVAGVHISMDGRERFHDNVFIERRWRSLKYEEVYLKGYVALPTCPHRQ